MREDIEKALLSLGFVNAKGGNRFEKDGLSVKVYDNSTLEEVFAKLISYGKTQKMWEIQRILGIN